MVLFISNLFVKCSDAARLLLITLDGMTILVFVWVQHDIQRVEDREDISSSYSPESFSCHPISSNTSSPHCILEGLESIPQD